MARGDHAGAALATGSGIAARMAERTIRNASRLLMRNHVDLTVTGLDHVPATGPVVIAARHFHHLYDGTAILTSVPRTVRILVALDWVTAGAQRRLAEGLCTMAGWPVVLRPPRAGADGVRVNPDGAGSADRHEPERYLWRAFRQSARWLGDGGALLIFPEAYPNIDPSFTPKTADPARCSRSCRAPSGFRSWPSGSLVSRSRSFRPGCTTRQAATMTGGCTSGSVSH